MNFLRKIGYVLGLCGYWKYTHRAIHRPKYFLSHCTIGEMKPIYRWVQP